MVSWQSFKSLHLKLLDIDHPLTFKESKLRQIEAHALIYLTYLTIGHTPLSSGGFATSRLCAFAFKGHVLGVEGREADLSWTFGWKCGAQKVVLPLFRRLWLLYWYP